MCSRSATGSRQASSTIWARWRGGNLLRAPDPGVVQQEGFQAAVFVTAADPPDGGPVTFHPGGNRLNRFARSNGEHDPSMLHLEPGQTAAAGHRLQDGEVSVGNAQGMGLASTHGPTSDVRAQGYG
jgi:hypothetical protein